ncbi:MAG: hypothetical protein WDO13_16855 [Verrucomicrobiota bacterium]
MPGVTIGADCVTGACSVVTKDMPAGMICAGQSLPAAAAAFSPGAGGWLVRFFLQRDVGDVEGRLPVEVELEVVVPRGDGRVGRLFGLEAVVDLAPLRARADVGRVPPWRGEFPDAGGDGVKKGAKLRHRFVRCHDPEVKMVARVILQAEVLRAVDLVLVPLGFLLDGVALEELVLVGPERELQRVAGLHAVRETEAGFGLRIDAAHQLVGHAVGLGLEPEAGLDVVIGGRQHALERLGWRGKGRAAQLAGVLRVDEDAGVEPDEQVGQMIAREVARR